MPDMLENLSGFLPYWRLVEAIHLERATWIAWRP
jgi:hypothetical protein